MSIESDGFMKELQKSKSKNKLRQFFVGNNSNTIDASLMDLIAIDPKANPGIFLINLLKIIFLKKLIKDLKEEQLKKITKLTKFFGEKPGFKNINSGFIN